MAGLYQAGTHACSTARAPSEGQHSSTVLEQGHINTFYLCNRDDPLAEHGDGAPNNKGNDGVVWPNWVVAGLWDSGHKGNWTLQPGLG